MFLVELLLAEGADPNTPEETVNETSFPLGLHIAAADNTELAYQPTSESWGKR